MALCVVKKGKEESYHELDHHLLDGTCELFWRSGTATIHYIGRFRLVEGIFPYTERELAPVRKDLKTATGFHPTSSGNLEHEFVVLEYAGWTEGFVDPLTRCGYMKRD